MENSARFLCLSTLCLCLIAGCEATTERTFTIQSDPSGAQVRATADQGGPQAFFIGRTPLEHTFTFGITSDYGPTMYNLEFVREGYEKKAVPIRKDEASSTIMVTLDQEIVKEVPKLVVVVSEEKGYTVEKRTARAWIEDIEREGMAASSIVRLGDRQSIWGMTLSPDGVVLYFALAEPVTDEKGLEKIMANLRSINTGGGGITQVTSGQWLDAHPSCSDDGNFLVFNSNRLQNDKPDLFRISTERTSGIAVIRQTAEGANFEGCIGKGGIVAFTYKPKYQGQLSGENQIWTLGGDAEYPTQLRNGSMGALSPDGREIAYIGDDQQLWKMPVTGQNPVQLTSEAPNREGKKNPSWTPDGTFILFASDVGKDNKDVPNYDIWMIPSNGGVPMQLTTNGSEDDYPVASPDQKYIYFVSNRGFKEGIWRIPFPKI